MQWSDSQALWWEQRRAKGRWWYVAMHTLSYGLGISVLQFIISQAWVDVIDFDWGLVVINLVLGTVIGPARWAHGESHYREARGSSRDRNADSL